MSPLPPRSSAIETLQRMTSRLADSSLTIDEANLLLPLIRQLVEEINAGGSHAMVPDLLAWPVEKRPNGNMPGAQAPAAVKSR